MNRWNKVISLVARLLLGGTLAVAGLIKLTNIPLFAQGIHAYQLTPLWLSRLLAYCIPSIEIIIGLFLITGLFTRLAAIAGSLLMLIFLFGIAWVWIKGINIDCGCFGGGGKVAAKNTNYTLDTLRDILFLISGIWLIIKPKSLFSLDAILSYNEPHEVVEPD